MTLPTSGTILASEINIELGRAVNAPFSLGGMTERILAGKVTGAISFRDFYGKSSYVREPETGENYDPPASSAPTFWASNPIFAMGYLYWQGQFITRYFSNNTQDFVYENWLYHKGEFKEQVFIDGASFSAYKTWRETAPAGAQTREPPTGGIYSSNQHLWKERGNDQAWVVWNGVQTFASAGGFDHKVIDGWDYHRGNLVTNNAIEDGLSYRYYRIYRVKL